MTENNEKIKYELFIAHTDDTSLTAADNLRYTRVTPKYCLFYTQSAEKPHLPEKIAQVTDEDADLLPFEDKAWLQECNEAIVAEYIAAHEEQAAKDFQQFQREFERELAAEREAAKGETVNAGEGN